MVFISQGLFLFNDKEYKTNSYLLTDNLGNLVIVDPTINNVHEILEPISEEETVKAILLTDEYLPEYSGIVELVEKYNDIQIYINENAKLNLVNFLNEINNQIDWNSKIIDLPRRLEINEITLNIIPTPGISKGASCFRYKTFYLTGMTLLTHKMPDLSISDIDKHELKITLNNLQQILQPTYFVCPREGNVERFKQVQKSNLELNEFLRG